MAYGIYYGKHVKGQNPSENFQTIQGAIGE